MIKLCRYPAFDDRGNQLIEVFYDPDMLHHSYMDKVAAPFQPKVREYLDSLRPDPTCVYALINALGAGELWSSNINGDFFEEEMLIHPGPVWGYETFVHYAKPFMHHCFRAGTEVVMGDRTRKPIALVKPGELVETRLGPRPVKRSMSRPYDGPGVRLSLAGVAEDLEGSWDHPVFVFQRDRIHCPHRYSRLRPGQKHFEEYPSCLSEVGPSPEEVPLGEVLPGDYMVFPRPKLGGERIPDEFAELVGWVASEGYCAGQRGMIQFTFCEFNYEDIKSVNDCLESNGLHVTRTDLPDKEQVVLSSWSVELWDKLQEYVVGVKSEKHLTGKVLTWDERAIGIMLGAYVDGDGHVPEKGRNEGQLRIRSSSPHMLSILSDVMRALCVPTTIQWDQKPGYRTFPHGETYWCAGSGTVTVTPQFSPEITRRSRKHHIKDVQAFRPRTIVGDLFLVRVTKREDTLLNEDLYNLEVEDIPEYVAGEVLVHNCNKGPTQRAFGSVELSTWHPEMKRVELVVKLDRAQAPVARAESVFNKIDNGELPETSMGCKVPYDLCSITTDWELYRKALSRFDPRRHRHPGVAVLEFHKRVRLIKGLSITKEDYSDYSKNHMNEILPDGRKVFVYNPYPRFFDISFVFIGAEKTSKMMAKLASRARVYVPRNYGSSFSPDDQPKTHKEYEGLEKAASMDSLRRKLRDLREKKASQRKRAEIIKDVVPSQFMGKAVPLLEQSEPDLSNDLLDRLGSSPLSESLSTPTALGIVLKPREFQRITLVRLGKGDLADELDRGNRVFSPSEETDKSIGMGPEFVSKLLASLLKDSIEDRSVFGPPLARRMMRITICKPAREPEQKESGDELLDKVSAAYNGYREQVIEKIASLTGCLNSMPDVQAAIYGRNIEDIFTGVEKTAAGANIKLLLGAIPATYLASSLARMKLRRDMARGRETGLLTQVLADHPHLAATAVGLTALKATGSNLPDKILKGALEAGKALITK
jgi:hypothetical protein